eukprot:SAG11_NODE_3879_length_2171_cov_5.673745_2_plen_74_part_00
MGVVDAMNSEYGEQPQQGELHRRGDAYSASRFPNLSRIVRARRRLAEPAAAPSPAAGCTDELDVEYGEVRPRG